MRRMTLIRVTLCLLAAPAPYYSAQLGIKAGAFVAALVIPQAQAQGSGFTPQELDRMSQERTQVFGGVKHGPPPPQSSIPKEQTYQPSELWVCKGITAWQPIYSQASLSSPVMAKTMNMIAVGGRNENGFARTLLPSGRIGWVPVDQLHDYVNEFNPHATCEIDTVRANGGAIYTVR